jgi:hypothetical protein
VPDDLQLMNDDWDAMCDQKGSSLIVLKWSRLVENGGGLQTWKLVNSYLHYKFPRAWSVHLCHAW